MRKWVWSPLTIWDFLSGNCGVFSGSLQWALHCSQLWTCQARRFVFVYVRVFLVCLLPPKPHKVSSVTTALNAMSERRPGMQHTQSTQSECHPCGRIHMWQMWWQQIDEQGRDPIYEQDPVFTFCKQKSNKQLTLYFICVKFYSLYLL